MRSIARKPGAHPKVETTAILHRLGKELSDISLNYLGGAMPNL